MKSKRSIFILAKKLIAGLIEQGCKGARYLSLCYLSAAFCTAKSFEEFGIIRANIAVYCSDHRWLVCFEPKRFPDTSEVVGFDPDGNVFRIRGELRGDKENMLSLKSYDKPSVSFSTKEGYFYHWNANDGGNPFETPLKEEDYGRILKKFELYPLLKESKDAPVWFERLRDHPEFYQRAIALPRPQSMFHLENPTARRVKIGIFPAARPTDDGFQVQSVVENSAAAEAGIEAREIVTKLAINGTSYDMKKGFPLPDEVPIRILSLRVGRNSAEGRTIFRSINIFPPSALEQFLFR